MKPSSCAALLAFRLVRLGRGHDPRLNVRCPGGCIDQCAHRLRECFLGPRRLGREQISEGVLGVLDVHNRLTIRKDDPTDANVAFVLPLGLLSAL